MSFALNVALLLLGAAATAAAFGGKTWSEGTEPIYRRITLRGKISIACLTLSLALGITKGYLDAVGSKKAGQTANDTLDELKTANDKVAKLTMLADEQKARIDSAFSGLLAMNLNVSSIDWRLSTGRPRGPETSPVKALLPDLPDMYAGMVYLSIDLCQGFGQSPPAGSTLLIADPDLTRSDAEIITVNAASGLIFIKLGTDDSPPIAAHWGSGGLEIHRPVRGWLTAAEVYGHLKERFVIAGLTIGYEKEFASDADAKKFVAALKGLQVTEIQQMQGGVRYHFRIPLEIAKIVQADLSAPRLTSSIQFTLDEKSKPRITSGLSIDLKSTSYASLESGFSVNLVSKDDPDFEPYSWN
ncbi:MAG TPA: hypothetical protein VII56_17030 [Rhizomicrobium sp.]